MDAYEGLELLEQRDDARHGGFVRAVSVSLGGGGETCGGWTGEGMGYMV